MGKYAEGTTVSTGRSLAEIQDTVARYGADGFMSGWEEDEVGRMRATVRFRVAGRAVRFDLPLPKREEYTSTPTGKKRTAAAAAKAWEQACRQRWRALSLAIKAKLEVVESGISEFDVEFLPHLLLADGSTVAEQAMPALRAAFEAGTMPTRLLPPVAGGAQ